MAKSQSSNLEIIASEIQSSPFLSLPPELRTRIYDFVLIEEHAIMPAANKHRKQPGITKTCRQIRAETIPIYYGKNEWQIEGGNFGIGECPMACKDCKRAEIWVQVVGCRNFQYLTKIKLDGLKFKFCLHQDPRTKKITTSDEQWNTRFSWQLCYMTEEEELRLRQHVERLEEEAVEPGLTPDMLKDVYVWFENRAL